MNKLGKSGAILVIIGSAFMLILSLVAIFAGSLLTTGIITGDKDTKSVAAIVVLILGIFALGFSIVNIVLASLVLSGRKNLLIVTGVLALVSLLFGWIAYIIPAILLLIGAILLFCGNSSKTEDHKTVVEIKTVQPEANA